MDEIIQAVEEADRITAFTGAGMSVESGIAPFRGEDGVWKEFDPQEVASAAAFAEEPKKCWELFKLQIEGSFGSDPHKGHQALVELEEHGLSAVITQNIDGLHQRAGNDRVMELHGSLDRLICPGCEKIYQTERLLEEIKEGKIPRCECGEILKPDVVLFGEALPRDTLKKAWKEAKRSDLLFSLGTSAVVQPAASIPIRAKRPGGTIIEINLKETPLTEKVSDHFIEGKVGKILPEIVDRLADRRKL
ncbi:MAG: SIR2 family NAD-dependent protein deacylase [Thermoplasmata archaeon]